MRANKNDPLDIIGLLYNIGWKYKKVYKTKVVENCPTKLFYFIQQCKKIKFKGRN